MENWKQINDRYEVSDTGLVRNYTTGRILKQQSNQKGQLTILLSDNGNDKRILVSRLVATAFIENPNKYDVVMHDDDNPKNNNVNNLLWGTQKMNMDDMINKGRSKRIITDDVVKFIKQNHYRITNQYDKIPNGKYSTSQLAEKFNITKSAIMPILQNKRYKHI
jgi:hypothetical protein